eukprot:CAMPEP_0173076256 /NCGR_PEP_ID=MMETSP1102-20130122/12260_1 /TAXON_ID=49646 /ORGANISM="Geminigera sp., Strain Caron Lab Isolate" /LENGTH=44 /DNA_ID= /DNA_START= /DNA_END= /DNA_ORIENTATION=
MSFDKTLSRATSESCPMYALSSDNTDQESESSSDPEFLSMFAPP